LEHPTLVHFNFILFKKFFSFRVISLKNSFSHPNGHDLFLPYFKVQALQKDLSHFGQQTGSQAKQEHIEQVNISRQFLSFV
jgi:hypothetical protein